MHTLFLDFCSHRRLLAVVSGQTVTEDELADHTDETAVMPAIETLVKRAGVSLHDISRIAAVTGPGGFMSQRVGLSIANALAWSLKIPIGALHLSDLYAARISGDALWIHSTKKKLLFIRGFGAYAKKWPEAVTITLDELSEMKNGAYVGEVLPEQAAVLSIAPVTSMKSIASVLPDVLETVAYAAQTLTPWYGREA